MILPWTGGLFHAQGTVELKPSIKVGPWLTVEVGPTKRGPWTLLFTAQVFRQAADYYNFSVYGASEPDKVAYVKAKLDKPSAGEVKFGLVEVKL